MLLECYQLVGWSSPNLDLMNKNQFYTKKMKFIILYSIQLLFPVEISSAHNNTSLVYL